MCAKKGVCEREREGGGEVISGEMIERVKYVIPPEISGAQGIVWLNPSPLTPRQYISPFFLTLDLPIFWYLPNLRGMIPSPS